MSRHTIVMNDIECLVVLDALRMLIENANKHKDDKRIAQHIRHMIKEIVVKDKNGGVNDKSRMVKG